jgi:hypothetical protein
LSTFISYDNFASLLPEYRYESERILCNWLFLGR